MNPYDLPQNAQWPVHGLGTRTQEMAARQAIHSQLCVVAELLRILILEQDNE